VAITPEGIKTDIPLTAVEEAEVSKFEAEIDGYLALNHTPGFVTNYICQESLSRGVLRELLSRYRQAGWYVTAKIHPETGLAMFWFMPGSAQGEIIQRFFDSAAS
jgi:hypothetical protein